MTSHRVRRVASSVVALALWVASSAASAQALGSGFTYQGQLKEAGQPATGLYDLQVCLFDSGANPIPLACAADFSDVPVEGGLFTITLDFGSAPFVGQQRFIELRIRPGASTGGYTILSPRQLVRPAPEALRANVAAASPWSGLTGVPPGFADGVDNDSGGTVTQVTAGNGLTGGTITGTGTINVNPAQVQTRVGQGCAAGSYVRSVNEDGTVVCGTDANSGGTVTSVATGVGLTGGPITATGTVAIADGGVGLTQINTAQVQARVGSNCAVGSSIRAINADGTVVCHTDVNSGGTVTLVATGQGLTGGPVTSTGTIAIADQGVTSTMIADGAVSNLKLAQGSVTASKIAPEAVGAPQVNPSQIQLRVFGTCPFGEYVRGINVDGTVNCQPLVVPPLISTIDSNLGGSTVQGTAVAVGQDGNPVIAYYSEQGGGSLRAAKCIDPACAQPPILSVIDDPANDVGYFPSIAIGVDGAPIISYQDFTARSLKAAKCANPSCVGGATITTVEDTTLNLANTTSIAIGLDGNPVISYLEIEGASGTDLRLKVAKCINPNCTGSSAISIVDDPANNVGSFSSIAIPPDGNPVISYRDSTAASLKVAKCLNESCAGGAVVTTVDDPVGDVGEWTSIAIAMDGMPIVSYKAGGGIVKIAKCIDPACASGAVISSIPSGSNEVYHTSVKVPPDGHPVISFSVGNNSKVGLARCLNASCSSGATRTVLDQDDGTNYPSLAIGSDGLPVISYRAQTVPSGGGILKVVKCGSPSCQ